MTTEEVTKFAEYAQYMAEEMANNFTEVKEFYRCAETALRAQQERENPEPLTLGELREMDGQPVWCVSMITGKAEWAILRIVEMKKTWFIAIAGASAGYGDKDTYGQTWLAYRYKPKEKSKC